MITTMEPRSERLFSGLIGETYDLLRLLCPEAADMSHRVGQAVAALPPAKQPLRAVELGCGTGVTTLALLQSRGELRLTAIDNEPTLLEQARRNLARWAHSGHLHFVETDALSALGALPDNGIDLIASAYTLHNFLEPYRRAVIREIHRVLRPGGSFINGDRYALDDTEAHTRLVQQEAAAYFERIRPSGRYDVLQQWIVHLFSDESPDHVMRTAPSLAWMTEVGFRPITLLHRDGVNALVQATKPQDTD